MAKVRRRARRATRASRDCKVAETYSGSVVAFPPVAKVSSPRAPSSAEVRSTLLTTPQCHGVATLSGRQTPRVGAAAKELERGSSEGKSAAQHSSARAQRSCWVREGATERQSLRPALPQRLSSGPPARTRESPAWSWGADSGGSSLCPALPSALSACPKPAALACTLRCSSPEASTIAA